MASDAAVPIAPRNARHRLVEAAFAVIRQKGYAATTVDELCGKAGVTKGAFFHHFASKDALALEAVSQWSVMSTAFFAEASYHHLEDPLERVLGYLDFRKAILSRDIAEFSCLAGTLVQETYRTHPDIRQACDDSISGHAATLVSDITEAMTRYKVRASWTAESLALHTQVVLQGAFILAKGSGNSAVVEASIDHLRRYVEQQFRGPRLALGPERRPKTVLSKRDRI